MDEPKEQPKQLFRYKYKEIKLNYVNRSQQERPSIAY